MGKIPAPSVLKRRQGERSLAHEPRFPTDLLPGSTHLLRDANAVATLAVKDLPAAAKFYEETLGLSRAGSEDNEVVTFESGDTRINVYQSSFAGTNKATAVTWTVDDVEDIVRTLRTKGVKFEQGVCHQPRCGRNAVGHLARRRGFGIHIVGERAFASDRAGRALVAMDLANAATARAIATGLDDLDGLAYSPVRLSVLER